MDKSLKIKLIPVDAFNYDIIRVWRNHNRKYFINQKYVEEEDHHRWFAENNADKNTKMFLIESDKRLAGMIKLKFIKNYIEINNVLIAYKKDRGKGIMSEVMDMVVKKYPKYKMFLEVLKNNKNAIDFYEGKGFSILKKGKNKITMLKKL